MENRDEAHGVALWPGDYCRSDRGMLPPPRFFTGLTCVQTPPLAPHSLSDSPRLSWEASFSKEKAGSIILTVRILLAVRQSRAFLLDLRGVIGGVKMGSR